ncbi:MAG: hypothetical protein VX500_09555 [Planctomycetota bacterium]|nr:hypothetical protein [Planctomycetota bacterium]
MEQEVSSNRILVIGSSPNERFAYSEAAVSWHFVPTVEAADRWLADEDAKVEQVWLHAATPGQFTQADVDFLMQRWPLVLLIYVAGDWCEGELRSGWPVQGVPRRLLPDLLKEMDGNLREGAKTMRLAESRTSQAFEQWMQSRSLPVPASREHVLGVTEWRETWEAIRDGLKLVDHEVSWWQPGKELPELPRGGAEYRCLLVDLSRGVSDAEADFINQAPKTIQRRLAILGFSRPQDIRQLKEWGYDDALFKPLRLENLLDAIQPKLITGGN